MTTNTLALNEKDRVAMATLRKSAKESNWMPESYTEEDWLADVEHYLCCECDAGFSCTPNTKIVEENTELRRQLMQQTIELSRLRAQRPSRLSGRNTQQTADLTRRDMLRSKHKINAIMGDINMDYIDKGFWRILIVIVIIGMVAVALAKLFVGNTY
jgi:hypothetical protein